MYFPDENASGGEQPESVSTAASETEKVETLANEEQKASEAATEDAPKADAAKTEDEKAKEASEAGKKLNQYKQTASARVQQAIAKQREAERTAERALARVAQLEGKLKAPNAEDYNDASKLNADQIAHALDQRRIAELKEEHADAAGEAQKARAVAWFERVEAFRADNADFETVAHSAPIGEKTSLMVADMEDGPAVAYHLGKNPAEARRIEALPEGQRPFALGKIAAQVTAPPPRRVTAAPGPVETTSGKSGGGAGFDPVKASPEEYSAYYRKQKGRG